MCCALEGSINLLLDDGPHRLGPGDSAVVNGVDHGRQTEESGCRMSVVVIATPPLDRRGGCPYGFVKEIGSAQGGGQDGWVADLLWDDVKCFFDPDLMGSLPDVLVLDTSVEDWQAVLDLIAASGWKCQYSEGETVLPVPRAEAVLSRPADAERPELRVWPTADVLAIFRFYSVEEIDFDVDLRELQGQERLDVFCGFLRAIGRRLGKPVLMGSEGGDHSHPVVGFDVETDQVVLLAEPLIT